MAGKRYYKTKELAESTLALIQKDRAEWEKFLTFCSHHYKYSFEDALLIYAQRPDATAVTDMNTWNSVLNRRIKRGTRSIAVFDSTSDTGLKYLFDVEDTYGITPPEHWQIEDEHIEQVKESFLDTFENNIALNLNQLDLATIIDNKIRSDCSEYMDDIQYEIQSSYLEELDQQNIEIRFVSTVMDSVGHIVNKRTGLDVGGEQNMELAYSALWEFNTTPLKLRLYRAINDIAKDILSTIELSVKHQNQQMLINERSTSNEHDIHTQRRNIVSESRSSEELQTNNTDGQIREDVSEIFGGDETAQSNGNETQRNTNGDVSKSGHGSSRNDGYSSGATAQGESNQAQEHNKGSGGGKGTERDSIPTAMNIEGDEEGVELSAPSLLSQDFATQEEREKYINELAAKYEKEDIEHVLLRGSSFVGGRQRIVDFFQDKHTHKEKAKFLKDEYGIGGFTADFIGDRRGFVNYNAKGIQIENKGIGIKSINLKWSDVAKKIDELIENGKYFEKHYSNQEPLNRKENKASQISFIDTEQEEPKQETLKEPIATVLWSENGEFEENSTYTLNELNSLLIKLDREKNEDPESLGYDKTKIQIKYSLDNEIQTYEFRYDIGDMDGGIVKHIRMYWTNLKESRYLFPDIKDGDFDYILNDFVPYIESFIVDSIKEAKKQYDELFNQILKQGDITQKGKEKIVGCINNYSEKDELITKLKEIYGEFYSEIKTDGKIVYWHIGDSGYRVFVNGFDKQSLDYTWDEVVDRLKELIHEDEYIEESVWEEDEELLY